MQEGSLARKLARVWFAVQTPSGVWFNTLHACNNFLVVCTKHHLVFGSYKYTHTIHHLVFGAYKKCASGLGILSYFLNKPCIGPPAHELQAARPTLKT